MKYVPLVIASAITGIVVAYALFLTGKPICLWGLAAFYPIGHYTWKISETEANLPQ